MAKIKLYNFTFKTLSFSIYPKIGDYGIHIIASIIYEIDEIM